MTLFFFFQEKVKQEKLKKEQEKLKKEQEKEKEKKKAVTSSISSILKAKERSTKKHPVIKTDSDEDDEEEVSTKGTVVHRDLEQMEGKVKSDISGVGPSLLSH